MMNSRNGEGRAKPRGRIFKRLGLSCGLMVLLVVVLNALAGLAIGASLMFTVGGFDPDLLTRLIPDTHDEIKPGTPFSQWWTDRLPPVSFTINHDGYRGKAVSRAREPGELRIVCLGDSVTFGLAVDEDLTYPSQLERMLMRRFPGPKITVINGGVPGYSSRQGMYLLQARFLDYRPDFVVWGFGFHDAGFFPGGLDRFDVTMIPLKPGARMHRPLKFRVIYWLLQRPLFQVILASRFSQAYSARFADAFVKLEEAKKTGHIPFVHRTRHFYANSRVPPDDYEDILRMLRDLGGEHGFTPIIVTLFGTPEVYQDINRRFAEANGLPYVDMKREFERLLISGALWKDPKFQAEFKVYRQALVPGAIETNPMLYLTLDGLHPNSIGDAVIANQLTDVIATSYEARTREKP